MQLLEIRNTIALIVETMFFNRRAPVNDPSLGIHFCIHLSFSNNGYENDGNTLHLEWKRHVNMFVHVIVTSQHRVYVAESDTSFIYDVKPESFVNTSNHSSGWRTEGLAAVERIASNAMFYCREGSPPEHQENSCSSFCLLGNNAAFNFVHIRRGPYVDGNHYHDTLTSVSLAKWKVEVQEKEEQ